MFGLEIHTYKYYPEANLNIKSLRWIFWHAMSEASRKQNLVQTIWFNLLTLSKSWTSINSHFWLIMGLQNTNWNIDSRWQNKRQFVKQTCQMNNKTIFVNSVLRHYVLKACFCWWIESLLMVRCFFLVLSYCLMKDCWTNYLLAWVCLMLRKFVYKFSLVHPPFQVRGETNILSSLVILKIKKLLRFVFLPVLIDAWKCHNIETSEA